MPFCGYVFGWLAVDLVCGCVVPRVVPWKQDGERDRGDHEPKLAVLPYFA